MNSSEKPPALSGPPSFETVLDQTCDRLWDRKVQYSIRRLREMEGHLSVLEQELDALILLWEKNGAG
jgi:hypothetical protein